MVSDLFGWIAVQMERRFVRSAALSTCPQTSFRAASLDQAGGGGSGGMS